MRDAVAAQPVPQRRLVKTLAMLLGQSVHDSLTAQLRLRCPQCCKPVRIGVQLEGALSAWRIGMGPCLAPAPHPADRSRNAHLKLRRSGPCRHATINRSHYTLTQRIIVLLRHQDLPSSWKTLNQIPADL